MPNFLSYFTKINWNLYVPLILVAISYICLVWAYRNLVSQYLYILDYGVGSLVFLVIIRQIIALKENESLYQAAKDEIDKRMIIEKALQKSEKKYRGIVENADEGIVSTDINGSLIFYNDRFAKMLGYNENELNGMEIFSLMDEKSKKIAKKCMINVKEGNKGQNELNLIKKDETVISALTRVSPILENNQYKGCLALISDITESKRAQKQIEESLKEKEVMIKEIHHRVKNNMQIITSLLSLQSRQINDEKILDIFKESQNRVKSMALVHEKLYSSDNMSKIEAKDYINSIVFYLFSSYGLNSNLINFNLKAENIYFDVDTAIPIALIINETITNTLKYAFPHNQSKMNIEIDIKSENSEHEMIIKDNGIGLEEGFDFYNISTLGLNLVYALVEQIDGKIEILNTKGTAFRIIF